METKITIFQLIDKLKEINVNEVIEKSKSISLEDVRSISWKDIKSSKFTRPFTGITLFFIFIFIFLIPEVKNYTSKKIISEVSSLKNRNLEKLEINLEKSLLIKSILDSNLKEFETLTADKSKIINLTNLITEAAKRSLVEIKEFSPIDKQELSSCQATQGYGNNEMEPSNFNSNNGFNGFPLEDDTSTTFNEESIELDPLEKLNSQLDYLNNNENFLRFISPKAKAIEIPNQLNKSFDSNYFKVEIVSDYINLLNFLRSIQEYKIIIIPMCFEPTLLTQASNANQKQNLRPAGFVRAKLMIDVPTYK